MPSQQICIQETVRAPREQLFDLFADHDQFATLFGGKSRRIKDGKDHPDGLGSVRCIGRGFLSFDETVVAFERPRRIEYTVTRGSLFKNHKGTIVLNSSGSTTLVEYVIRFDSKVPGLGGCLAWLLRHAWARHGHVQLERLAKASAQPHNAPRTSRVPEDF